MRECFIYIVPPGETAFVPAARFRWVPDQGGVPLGRLVYGADDPKGGAVVHGARVFDQPTCHWKPEVEGGVLAEESAQMLRGFFRAKRK